MKTKILACVFVLILFVGCTGKPKQKYRVIAEKSVNIPNLHEYTVVSVKNVNDTLILLLPPDHSIGDVIGVTLQ